MNARIVMGSCAAAILVTGAAIFAAPVTLVGCVQPESTSLKSRSASAKPNSGYVLIETRRAVDTTAAVSDHSSNTAEPAPVGTSGGTSTYRLSGRSADLKRLSGKYVEAVGTMKGATLNVMSLREVPGICDTP